MNPSENGVLETSKFFLNLIKDFFFLVVLEVVKTADWYKNNINESQLADLEVKLMER